MPSRRTGGGGGGDSVGGARTRSAMTATLRLAQNEKQSVRGDPGSAHSKDFLNLYKQVQVCRHCYWVYSEVEEARRAYEKSTSKSFMGSETDKANAAQWQVNEGSSYMTALDQTVPEPTLVSSPPPVIRDTNSSSSSSSSSSNIRRHGHTVAGEGRGGGVGGAGAGGGDGDDASGARMSKAEEDARRKEAALLEAAGLRPPPPPHSVEATEAPRPRMRWPWPRA